MAEKAAEQAPERAWVWPALGVARYRAGKYAEAIEALEESDRLRPDARRSEFNAFFLAMAHWQLGHQDEARQWYDKAVERMEKNRPDDEELLRFRAEAEELMGIEKQKKRKSQVSRQGSDAFEFAATSKPTGAPKPR